MSRGIVEGIAHADAVLLGRRTFEQFARIWPSQGSEVPMADFLNNSPKYVVSSTLREPLPWAHSTVMSGDLGTELGKLKAQSGKNIQVPGSPTLVRWLLRNGLLDQLNLSVCPVIVGHGMRLFDDIGAEVSLKLVHSVALSNGVLGLAYEPAPTEGAMSPADFPAAAAAKR